MKKEIYFILTLILFTLNVIASEPMTSSEAPTHLSVGRDFLTAEQIKENTSAALKGDIKAAVALSNYYLYFENEIPESNFWIQLAAEHSDCAAAKEYLGRVQHIAYLDVPKRVDNWKKRVETSCAP